MKKNKITLIALAMTIMFGKVVNANEIYMEQVGNNSTISIIQQGSDNTIGTEIDPIYIGSGSNTITIDQIGSTNSLAMLINGASTNATLSVTGSSNTQEITCGTKISASCSSSVINQTITGDDNTTTVNFSNGANHTSTINITGDTNNVTHTSTNTGITSASITVTGNTNTIGVTQSGNMGQAVVVNSSGNNNNITINQSPIN